MESTIEIIQVKASELVPAEYNPRCASEKECQDLKASILAFGLVDPIIVNSATARKNIVIGGHFRLRMAIELGFDTVPVVYLNIPELAKEQELNLRLNKNSGQWDFDLLANFDEDLLKLSGFKSDELQKIFDIDVQDDGFDAEAEYGKISEAQTKPGDIYQMGNHRLMCGDSTKQEDVARLMGSELADMMFTDPPYNVNYNYAKYDAIGKHRIYEPIMFGWKEGEKHYSNHSMLRRSRLSCQSVQSKRIVQWVGYCMSRLVVQAAQ